MLLDLFFFSVIMGFIFLSQHFTPVIPFSQAPVYALGVIMLSGYLMGKIVRRFGMPVVSGYLFMGVLSGPYILGFISRQHVADLHVLNGLALSIIALTAGGEIKLAGLRKNIRSLSFFVILQIVIIISGIVLFIMVFRSVAPFFSDTSIFAGFKPVLAAAILVGIVAAASSPAATLAVIVESRLKNRYTEMILSVLMLKDICILFLFVPGLGLSRSFISHAAFEIGELFSIFLELAGSLAAGAVIGTIIIFFLKYVKREIIIFIMAISFFSYEIFEPLHLHPLLIMILAGFIVENFSSEGGKLIATLEDISPPVYILFFTLTGASLNISLMKVLWLITIILVLVRMGLIYTGAFFWARWVGEEPVIKKYFWMSFISQAGLSLGMAQIIASNLSTTGENISSLIITILIINLIIGPLMLKLFLDKTKKQKPPHNEKNGQ